MTERASIIQKLSGLAAVIFIAFLLISPQLMSVDRIKSNQRLLSERRNASDLLQERVVTIRTTLQEDNKVYGRLQHSLVAETIAAEVKETCDDAMAHFSTVAIQAACPAAQYQLGGGLLHHTALLTVSGPPEALLQALDSVSGEAVIDQLRITSEPETPETATLTLRFSDVSKAPDAHEAQE